MKKYFSLSLMALVSFVFVGCSSGGNDVLSNVEDNGKVTTITVSLPDNGRTRTGYEDADGYLKVTWAAGDKIAVYDGDTPIEFTLASGAGTQTATFTTTETFSTEGEYTVVYPYTEGKKSSEVLDAVVSLEQEGDLANLGKYDVMTGTATNGTVSNLDHQIAVVKIVTNGGQTGVSIRGAWGDTLYSATSTAATSYIAVPVATATTLYASYYDGSNCYCYERTKSSPTTLANKMAKFDITGTETVKYPATGIAAGHEYVTIGSKNWATCNVGACVPWEYGNYYNWGMLTDHREQTNKNAYYKSTSDIQKTANDVAHVNWGNGWMMPDINQLTALNGSSKNVWYVLNGINGRKIGTTSVYVFLPAAGFCSYTELRYQGSNGYCWSSTPYSTLAAKCFRFAESFTDMSNLDAATGLSVRPLLSVSE